MSDNLESALRDAQPEWKRDGKGIRGEAMSVFESKANTDWPTCQVSAQENNPPEVTEPSLPSGGGATTSSNSPFAVLDQSNPDDGLQVKVYKDSFLYPTTNLTAHATIDDLDSIQSVSVGSVVALKIGLDSGLALNGNPQIIFSAADWSGYPAMFHLDISDPDNPFVDEIRVLVAEIVDVADTRDGKTITDGSNSAKIIQHQRNNILLFAYPDVVDAAAVATYIPLSI